MTTYRRDVTRRDIVRYSPNTPPPSFILGLDLGQAKDPSALAIIQRRKIYEDDDCEKPIIGTAYHLRRLERYPLGTSYTQIVEDVAWIMRQPKIANNCKLVIDGTGAGSPVLDMFLQARLKPIAVRITAGESIAYSGNYVCVPKRTLVSTLQVLFQTDRLKICPDIENLEVLLEELRNFRIKITKAGNDTYSAWRERDHDDCVLALAIACWYGEHTATKPTNHFIVTPVA